MSNIEWDTIDPEPVDLEQIVWSLKNTDWQRIRRMSRDDVTTYAPIYVEELVTGQLYVHDGYHRALRTKLDGRETIMARVVRHGPVDSEV